MHFSCIFFAKIFGQFKNLLYLCTRFWETSEFRFSTGGPDIKIQILDRGPNFFAPNRRKDEANWKIDTISVVQELMRIGVVVELILNFQFSILNYLGSRKNSTLDKFDYSELSYKFLLQRRVWSWLRMNASDRPNTCKSRGNAGEACFSWRRPAHGCVTGVQSVHSRGIAQRKLN